MFDPNRLKIGVLGGGQLGKMLGLAASRWHLPLHFLDMSVAMPAGMFGKYFQEGDFNSNDDVYRFGRKMDILTIEIEHVATEALHQLKSEGIIVHPDPETLDLIKDKGLQKHVFEKHHLPTAPYRLFENAAKVQEAIQNQDLGFPFVQKTRKAGYDGRGVTVIEGPASVPHLLQGPCLVEEKIDIKKELSVIVAANTNGELRTFPTVEMEFHPEANLVEYLSCPARISPNINRQAQDIAISTMKAFGHCGLLAVELFLTVEDNLLINEVAPRPHNSGHHTIESCITSQFEQHLRSIIGLPLGSTAMLAPEADDVTRISNALSVAFLDAYLRNDPAARADLTGTYAQTLTGGRIRKVEWAAK